MPNYDEKQPKTRQEKGKGKKTSSETPYSQKRVRQLEELLAKSVARSFSMVGKADGKKNL